MKPLSLAVLLSAAGLSAQVPNSPSESKPSAESLAPVTVTGRGLQTAELPGSASFLDGEDFQAKGYTNLRQIAQQVPGVYIRDEDGYGNFPNISLRGVDGSRSAKVTLMEDGILTAPSPYAAPSAYYSPKAARMSGIEFLKGSSQVRYGPHTTGGVVNYLSTPLPSQGAGRIRLTHGSESTTFLHGWVGASEKVGDGLLGHLVELHAQDTEGFRQVDGSGTDTGYRLLEPMLKLGWQPDVTRNHRFELKLGWTDLNANESYVGVADQDLRENPDRRYAGTAFDRHHSEQWRTYLKWVAQPDEDTRLESALYLNTFRRNWDKLDALSGVPIGVPTNLGRALLDPYGLDVLQGLATGNIVNRDAFRDHQSHGWQTELREAFTVGSVRHELTMGVRLHRDTAGGTNQTLTRAADGLGGFGPATTSAVASAGYSEVDALALHIEDAIRLSALTLRPGIRQEWLSYASTSASGVATDGSTTLTTGGLGATYELSKQRSLFGGVHAGASPANPSGYLSGASAERSLGTEIGVRHRSGGLRWEVALFLTDFSDLIAPEVGVGGGGLTPATNAGSAQSRGVEALVGYDHGRASGWKLGTPLTLSATFTRARFTDLSGRLSNGAGLFAGAENGSEIPYVPEWKVGVSAGLEWEDTQLSLDAGWSSASWGTGYNERTRVNDLTELPEPSAIDGRIPDLVTVDFSFRHQLRGGLKLVGGIQNILDERELVSRAPLGPRANAPRSFHLGAEYRY
jgi:Fe(3+) dicitrate transport protein